MSRETVRSRAALAAVIFIVFALYLVTGAALPVLPLFVRDEMHLGTIVVGLVTGAQFGAAVIFRIAAGTLVDRHGPRSALLTGCLLASLAGFLYAGSLLAGSAVPRLAILLVGRALLGAGESLVIVGGQTWVLKALPDDRAGRAIGWIGTALFLGLAAGSPWGSIVYHAHGLPGLAGLTILLPLGGAAIATRLRRQSLSKAASTGQASLRHVAAKVWLPGLAMSLSTMSYGVMTAFSSLLFAERNWEPVWLGFTLFATALTAIRLCFGWLTDHVGGARVAIVSASIQAAGMGMLGFCDLPIFGFAGALIAGAGYALVYPAMSLMAIGSVGSQNRAVAIGVFSAFLDLSLGLSGPAAGALASIVGLPTVFLVAAVAGLLLSPLVQQQSRKLGTTK